MWSLQEELRMPLARGEGPIGIILAPSRELARQTYDLALYFAAAIKADGGPELRAMLAIGGEGLREQMAPLNAGGCHMIVGTPGRLIDHLTKKRLTLDLCKYMVLDEGDRMVGFGMRASCPTLPPCTPRVLCPSSLTWDSTKTSARSTRTSRASARRSSSQPRCQKRFRCVENSCTAEASTRFHLHFRTLPAPLSCPPSL